MHKEELIWTEPGDEEPEEGGTLVAPGVGEETEGIEDFASGSRIGERYVVLSRIGAGGMGVVYAAYDPVLDRRVALKLMHQQSGSEREAERASRRLAAEAKAMAQLTHPNVITVHDVGEIGGRVFIAMEFVEGRPLSDWMRASGRDWKEVLTVFSLAGQGLAAAHEAGLVHRDFKPDNVLVGDDGRVRVLDFGLARRFDAARDLAERKTAVDREAGTPAYMSPEQHLGKKLDHRADQFSFCVALYEALYGELPFSAKTRIEIAIAVTDGQIAPAPRGSPVPGWIRWALIRGLDPDPDGRWEDMPALLIALSSDPYRKWRLFAIWGVASLVVLTFAVVIAQATMGASKEGEDEGEDGPSECVASSSRMDEVWGSEQRAALTGAFTAVGQEWADKQRPETFKALDAWAADWKKGYGELCEAKDAQSEEDSDMLGRRTVCLEHGLDDFDELVVSLTSGEVAALVGARELLQQLPELDECTATAMQKGPGLDGPADEDREARKAREKVMRLLSRARRQEATHHAASALELSAKAVEEAGESNNQRLVAEALLVHAELMEAVGDPSAVEDLLYDAELYAERGRAHRLRAKILVSLARAKVERGELELARQEAARARAVYKGQGSARVEQSDLDIVQVMVLLAAGDLEKSEGAATSAIEELSSFAEAKAAVAELRHLRGRALTGLGRHEEAQSELQLALDHWADSLGGQHPRVARVRVDRSILAEAQDKGKEAREERDQVVSIYRGAFGEDAVEVAQALEDKALLLRRLGDNDAALASQRDAETIYREKVDTKAAREAVPELMSLARVLTAQGSILHETKDFGAAKKAAERAREVWDEAIAAQPKAQREAFVERHALTLAHLDCDRGERSLLLEDPVPARAVLELALAAALDEDDQALEARIRFALARAWATGDDANWDRALEQATAARNGFVALGDSDALSGVDSWLTEH